MVIRRLSAVAERFLSERSFSLIVAPAIADFEFERRDGVNAWLVVAVLGACASAAYEDLTSDLRTVGTFIALSLMPACYYAFLFMLCAPTSLRWRALDGLSLAFIALLLALSTSSAVVCYWPARLSRRAETETL